jgi:glutamine synthetase
MSNRKSTENYIMTEYIWLAADQSIRSKSRTLYMNENKVLHIPDWNYDGSSTGQAPGDSSEIILKPVAVYRDPFRGGEHKLVLCNGVKADGSNVTGYHRDNAVEIFNTRSEEDVWFGLEQEYVLFNEDGKTPLGWSVGKEPDEQGPYYCGVGTGKVKGREVVEEHYKKCLDAGIRISGVNAEVMLGQWEYQVGPSEGITSGDELWMSRYIMERVCEKHGVIVSLDPKPIEGKWNGSGCHTNFSTKSMRENSNKDIYMSIIEKLEAKQKEHIKLYGIGNERRLTGDCETASIDDFSYGVGDRGASIRIPSDVAKNNYQSGYLEDRRPASNMDPYLVTSKIAETIIY